MKEMAISQIKMHSGIWNGRQRCFRPHSNWESTNQKNNKKPFLPIRLTIFSDIQMKGNSYTATIFWQSRLTKENIIWPHPEMMDGTQDKKNDADVSRG